MIGGAAADVSGAAGSGRTAGSYIDLINLDMLYFSYIIMFCLWPPVSPAGTFYKPGGLPAVFAEVGYDDEKVAR